MKRMLLVLLSLGLALPSLGMSTSPPKKEEQKWEVERQQQLQLIGSFQGQAIMEFMKRGDERQIRFRLSNAENGTYDVEILRSSEKRVLGSLQYPSDSTKYMPSTHPEFENLYSGYWERFHVVKREAQAIQPGDGLDPPPDALPPASTPPPQPKPDPADEPPDF